MADEPTTSQKKPSKLWYLLPIFLNIIGGVIGYFVLKDRDRKFAERMLIVGAVMIVIGGILVPVLVFASFYVLGVTPFGGPARISCSPCFYGADFAYQDYSAGTLTMRTGSRAI